MVDFLTSVQSDRGPLEPIPVTLVSNGLEVDIGNTGINSIAGPSYVHRLSSSLGTTNATLIRSGATRVFRMSGTNTNAAARYLKLYNKATAPIAGTDFPFWIEALEANAPFNVALDALLFSTGLGYVITSNFPDSDTGAITSGDITTMNISYLY